MNDEMREIFGDPIVVYTRAREIDDGVLVDVSELAREAGLRIPVAMTRAAWAAAVEWPSDELGQSETGRLWDVIFVGAMAARRGGGQRISFKLSVVSHETGRPRTLELASVCGPGEDAEPVVTIMLPEED